MTNVPVKCREDGGPRRQALGRARAQERAVRTAMQEVQRVQREMTHKMGEMRGVAISNAAERERCTCAALVQGVKMWRIILRAYVEHGTCKYLVNGD